MTDMNMSEDMFLAGLESDTTDFDGLDLGYTAEVFDADTTADGDGEPSVGGATAESEADTTAQPSGTESEDTTDDKSERAGTKNTEENEQDRQDEQDNSVYRLKIRGQEREVTRSELIALAQKGADYDRVREGYDDIKGEAYKLRELAAAQGKTAEQVLGELAQLRRDGEVRATKERLLAGGMDENVATALAEVLADRTADGAVSAEGLAADKPSVDEGEEEAAPVSVERSISESIRKLIDVYGVTELPEEVTKLSVDKGLPPFEAYQAWMIAEGEKREAALKQQLAAERKNAENVGKSVGSLTGGGGAIEDAFLAGLNMEF